MTKDYFDDDDNIATAGDEGIPPSDDEEIEGAMSGGYDPAEDISPYGQGDNTAFSARYYTNHLAEKPADEDDKDGQTEDVEDVQTVQTATYSDSVGDDVAQPEETSPSFSGSDGAEDTNSPSYVVAEESAASQNSNEDSAADEQPKEPAENAAEEEQPKEPAENTAEDAHSAISADLIRGHINTIILRALYERDKYGYEIINDIEAKSHGQYTLKQPTLYSALKRLETQGYIKAYWKKDDVSAGGRRKYFTLTDIGKEMTEKNLAEWEYSRTIIDNLISDRAFDFNRPAPTPVDFTILRDSVSRVPRLKTERDDEPAESFFPFADSASAYPVQYTIEQPTTTATRVETFSEQEQPAEEPVQGTQPQNTAQRSEETATPTEAAEAQPVDNSEAKSTDAVTQSEAKTDGEAQTESEAKAESETITESETGPESGTRSESFNTVPDVASIPYQRQVAPQNALYTSRESDEIKYYTGQPIQPPPRENEYTRQLFHTESKKATQAEQSKPEQVSPTEQNARAEQYYQQIHAQEGQAAPAQAQPIQQESYAAQYAQNPQAPQYATSQQYAQSAQQQYVQPAQQYEQPQQYAQPVQQQYVQPAQQQYVQPVQQQYEQPVQQQYAQSAQQQYAQPAQQQPQQYTQQQYSQNAPQYNQAQPQAAPQAEELARRAREADEQARRQAHENYLKLISEPVQSRKQTESEESDTPVYSNRPAPERDYRNLIDGIFKKALVNGSVQTNYADDAEVAEDMQSQSAPPPPRQTHTSATPIVERGKSDGIRVMPSTDFHSKQTSTAKTVYDKGKTLLTCAAIVFGVCFAEFVVCLALMGTLNMHWAYPAVILALGAIQFAVFAVLHFRGIFGHCAKPTSSAYLSTSIIITIILILIICVLTFLLNVNLTMVSELVKYMIMPSVTALNITIFALSFYLLVR